ncbi:hypothetical protein DPMN_057636 [Dreissena polymorpha]|uniref:Uncharacterized protein n=1 Tax=Dreissena polymorpha TaxID=45954 RepID=A0A9D4HEH1_DREPO|nr:hypothetical protein DPMN_057636 [Dreissena polymorpha]
MVGVTKVTTDFAGDGKVDSTLQSPKASSYMVIGDKTADTMRTLVDVPQVMTYSIGKGQARI